MSRIKSLFFIFGLILTGPQTGHTQTDSPVSLRSPSTSIHNFEKFSTKKPLSLARYLQKPKLVVVIAIDQFRSDYLTRFEKRFLPAKSKSGELGGFKFLMMNGSYFPHAEYDILPCMTGPGHATILSGSYPYTSGIILNDWFDTKAGRNVYCVEDETQPIVGPAKDSEIGMSPMRFEGSTVGDEIKNAGYPSRNISIALKDRSSILLGGRRADLALWLSGKYQWVSSRYYLKEGQLPDWVKNLNTSIENQRGKEFVWTTKEKQSGLSHPPTPDPYTLKGTYGTSESLATPIGTELTTDAALAAINSLRLGHQEHMDMLTISYSSHDLLGHHFGPNARALEEMTVSEDRSISRLLNGLKKSFKNGLEDVVIVFTADHGVAPTVDFLKSDRVDAGYIENNVILEKVESSLNDAFGDPKPEKWIRSINSFNLYLNEKALSLKKVNKTDVEIRAKQALLTLPGIAHVVTKSEYLQHHLPPGFFARKFEKTYVASKNGDLVAFPKAFYMQGPTKTTHITGYSYDRTVPLILFGRPFQAGVYSSRAEVVDIAPTLSFILGVLPPAYSEGRILSEAIH